MAVSQKLTLELTYQNVNLNMSSVEFIWTSTQTGESYNDYTRTAKYYVSINGGAEIEHTVRYTLPKGKTKTIVHTGIGVSHNVEGKCHVKIRTWMDTRISAGVIEKTIELTLPDIPRATTPTFYSDTVDMGDTATIYLYRASEDFTHELYYSFAGGEFQYIAGDLDTVYYWAVPDLAEQIPNTASGTLTIRCVTKSGEDTIGTKDAAFTVRVPDSVGPTITGVSVIEATADLAAQFGAFVKDHTTLAVAISAEGAKGSTIYSYSTTVDGIVYAGNSFTTEALANYGTVNLVTTVTDSRRRSVSLTTPIQVLDYYPPQTIDFQAYRVDLNGDPKDDGDYVGVAFSYEVAPVGDKNTATAVIDFKRTTATTWEAPLMTSTSLNSSDVRAFDTVLTSDYQFDVRLTVVDWFGAEASYTVTLPTAKVILDIKAAGDGLAAGKTSEFPGFEVDMPANAESFLMIGVRNYELGDGYGYILYNNGMLLQWGAVSVTPTAVNTVTPLQVTFPIPYRQRPHITGTLLANSPHVVDWALGVGTTDAAALTGLVVYMTRTTMHATPFRWMALGPVDVSKLPEVSAE